jgi:dipeptidyl aminopeptidase/acylaminoacyl peptidase
MLRSIPLIAILLMSTSAQAAKRPMTLDDLFKFKRVADPQISPDGSQVVYVVTTMNVEANNSTANLWIAATDGKTPPRQLTTTEKKDHHPRWSPDGKKILFESTRSGNSQLWVIDLGGGEAKQLTTISTEAATGIWSRDGSHIAFVSAIYAEFSEKPFAESDKLNKEKLDAVAKSPVKARVFNRLFYRHWDSWVEDKRQHLFVMKADGSDVHDATPGDRDAYPTSTTFSVGDDFCFSPDGKFLVFTAVPAKDEAWSTNHDICRVALDNKSTNWENLTKDNPAADCSPQFSPDGKKLAYRSQKKAGYEADKWDLLIVEANSDGTFKSSSKNMTSKWDRAVDEFAWGPDWILMTADQGAHKLIFKLSLDGSDVGEISEENHANTNSSITVSANGRAGAFLKAAMRHPADVLVWRQGTVTMPGGGFELSINADVEISKANDALLAELDLPRPESVSVKGANGDPMQMWILKPPGFEAGKKYPLAFLVHGGPQGAWEDGWSFRWCPELWAAQGYVVALPNPRGSTGFGQKYTDEITGDWGGKCFEDLMKGLEYLEQQPYVDRDRMIAAGASFGGYMMNWFAVQTGKFKAIVCHCGVWDFDSMYSTTDEVWFDEWEHGGPPWGGNRESYEKHSPHRYAQNLGKFKTPFLLIQNDLDFRCPVGQGIELFTALQRQGVPSRFINFPDEGHWVLKPANSKRWHEEVFAWIKKYAPSGPK